MSFIIYVKKSNEKSFDIRLSGKSSGIAAVSQIQPKRHNAWICASAKSDTFSKLFKNKSPLKATERGFVLYHRDKL